MASTKVLVLAATGTQGLAVVRALLKEPTMTIHALTRDTKSIKAQNLASLSSQVKLFSGSFDDTEALSTAAEDCSAIFINAVPDFVDPEAEKRHIRSVLSVLASKKSVKRVIYSSAAGTADPTAAYDGYPDMVPGNLPYHFFLDKHTNEQAIVKACQENKWECTILQPAVFLTNLLEPMSSFQFPELKKEKKIRAMLPPETEFDWLDPRDIGRVAAKVLISDQPVRSGEPQFIPLASERATLRTVISAMEKAAGVSIGIEQVDREEAKKSEDYLTKAMTGVWIIDEVAKVTELRVAEKFGVEPVGIEDFFAGAKAAVKEALGP